MADFGDDLGGNNGQGSRHALRWTNAMSSFMLRRMVELIGQGVKTDKGFKEVHLNQVAMSLTEDTGVEVSGTQVYNHLRKWRAKWVKITRLRDISGSLWDDNLCMIYLDEEHYKGYIKDHPKDVDYLNVPLDNYVQMATIFGSGQATGRYAMASNEALGVPSELSDTSFNNGIETETATEGASGASGAGMGGATGASGASAAAGMGGASGAEFSGKETSSSGGKRKRTPLVSEEEAMILNNMSDAVREMANAIKYTVHAECHPDLYNAVMDLQGFDEEALLAVLTYLTNHKALSLVFIQMSEPRRAMWVSSYLAAHTSN